MDVLDHEASEDETARKEVPMKRPPSHEANRDLVQKQERYRSILTQAAASDEVVRQKWREWEKAILQLVSDEVKYAHCVIQILLTGNSEGNGKLGPLLHSINGWKDAGGESDPNARACSARAPGDIG